MASITPSQVAQLVGVWKLVSYGLFAVAGDDSTPVLLPYGDNPFGRIFFTDFGYMNATLTSEDRAKPIQSGPFHLASDEDIASVARDMITYSGPYKLSKGDNGLVLVVQVEIALDASWIGGPQIRGVELHMNEGKEYLTLRPVQTMSLPVR